MTTSSSSNGQRALRLVPPIELELGTKETQIAPDDVLRIQDVLGLDTLEDAKEYLRNIIVDEGLQLINSFMGYGLGERLAAPLDKLIHGENGLQISFKKEQQKDDPAILQGQGGRSPKIEVSTKLLEFFLNNTADVIGPLSEEEAAFQKLAGSRMAYTYAMTVGLMNRFTLGSLITEMTQTSGITKQVFSIGNEDFGQMKTAEYYRLLPHRLSARLTIDRLYNMSMKPPFNLQSDDAQGLVAVYQERRQETYEDLLRENREGISQVDRALANPLTPSQAQEFMVDLSVLHRSRGGLFLLHETTRLMTPRRGPETAA